MGRAVTSGDQGCPAQVENGDEGKEIGGIGDQRMASRSGFARDAFHGAEHTFDRRAASGDQLVAKLHPVRQHRHVFVAATSPVFPPRRSIIACRRRSFAFVCLARILSAGSYCPSSSPGSTMAGGIPERKPDRHSRATSHFGNDPRQFSLCLGGRNWLCVYRARPTCSSRAPPGHDSIDLPRSHASSPERVERFGG